MSDGTGREGDESQKKAANERAGVENEARERVSGEVRRGLRSWETR